MKLKFSHILAVGKTNPDILMDRVYTPIAFKMWTTNIDQRKFVVVDEKHVSMIAKAFRFSDCRIMNYCYYTTHSEIDMNKFYFMAKAKFQKVKPFRRRGLNQVKHLWLNNYERRFKINRKRVYFLFTENPKRNLDMVKKYSEDYKKIKVTLDNCYIKKDMYIDVGRNINTFGRKHEENKIHEKVEEIREANPHNNQGV